jgi:beta-galactosidase
MSNGISRRSFLAASTVAGLPAAGAAGLSAAAPTGPATIRERVSLDFGWRFHLGHADDPARDFEYGGTARGAFMKTGLFFAPSLAGFDDSDWSVVELPHDWAVDLEFRNDPVLVEYGSKPLGRGYPATSIGWYRRVFEIPAADLGKRLSVEFDGVFRDSITALNGVYLGRNLSGYAPFRYDITDFVNYGGKNVLVVRADVTQNEGWFYDGAGIYRHVWMVKTHPVHVSPYGTLVTSELRSGDAVVSILTEVDNDGETGQACRLTATVLDEAGRATASAEPVSFSIPPGARRALRQRAVLNQARLWSTETPHLYRLVTTIEAGGKAVDRYETPFGVRSLRFDAARGFFLNGSPVKIKGTCNHQDHAGVGSALPDRLQAHRIEKLKEMGSNAYRSAHNPPAPELLDACDGLGMLVMDETRTMSSSGQGLSELEAMVRRDRNHPSVILWSLGNEESELQTTPRGVRIAATMKRLVRRLDPSRPVTAGMNGAADGDWGKGISEVTDVQGCNYGHGPELDGFHAARPGKPMVGSETASTLSTRGIYAEDRETGYVNAYGLTAPDWGGPPEAWWREYVERPFLAGGFVWTGFDYRGEPTPFGWPCISSNFGIMDTCGFPKDIYYYYQAWWTDKPVLHLFPHWNWAGREGREIDVWCFTNLPRVELFLNGRSLGAKEVPPRSHQAWKVRYAPGVLEARGYGKETLTIRRQTAGPPARILLRPDRAAISADGRDLAMVTVQVVDAQDRLVPAADNEIAFRVTGSGRLLGVGNGNPASHESDRGPRRQVFSGLAMAIVQSSRDAGELRLEATSAGLEPATAVIEARRG